MKSLHRIIVGLISVTLMSMGSVAFAAGDVHAKKTVPTPAASSTNKHVKSVASQEITKRRHSLNKEAVVANDEIFHAILFLKNKDTKQAYKMLEMADGQLSVLLARDPNLKLAAIDVRASVKDLEASPNTINKAVKDAESALKKGKVQDARALLASLVSEMYIQTDYLPLEIYPAAIKLASKEIHATKLNAAEATLSGALGSIVTNNVVVPLPPIKAEGDVLAAEKLMKKVKGKVKNKKQILSLLNSADTHLANASALGYGNYQNIRTEIASIKSQVDAGTAKPDLFERINNLFHKLIHSKKT